MNELWRLPAVRAAVFLAGAVLALWLVYAGRAVIFPFAVSFCLAYLLDPLVDRFERRGVNRPAAIIILLAVVFAAFTAAVAFMGPLLWGQVESAGKNIPRYVKIVEEKVSPLIESIPQIDKDEVKKHISSAVSALGDTPVRMLKGVSGWVWSGLSGVVGLLAAFFNLVIIPVAAFYLLKDFDVIIEKIHVRVPAGKKKRVAEFFRKIDAVLSDFFRGQLIVAATMALILSSGLFLIGTPMGLLVGLVAGMANIVPYLSIVVGLLPAVILTWLQFPGWEHVAMVAALFAAAQALEGLVISPKVLEKAVGLHPVAVMASLLAGGHFFGFIGVLLAVPVAAVLKVALAEMDEAYLKSDFYTGAGEKE